MDKENDSTMTFGGDDEPVNGGAYFDGGCECGGSEGGYQGGGVVNDFSVAKNLFGTNPVFASVSGVITALFMISLIVLMVLVLATPLSPSQYNATVAFSIITLVLFIGTMLTDGYKLFKLPM